MSKQSDKEIETALKLDKIDYKIICQLLLNSDSKSISSILHLALSYNSKKNEIYNICKYNK